MDARLADHLDAIEQLRAEQARLLHRELGGILAAVRMRMSTLGATPDAGQLAQLDGQLAEALSIKQRIVEALWPSLLDHFGPGVALAAHFETQCRDRGVSFEGDVPFGLPVPAPDEAILLYRVGEAALARALDEGARSLRLSVVLEAGMYRLRVVAENASRKPMETGGFELYVPWLLRHGGRLDCRAEGMRRVVEAVIPLR